MSVILYNKTYYEGEQMTIDNGQRDLNGTNFDDNVKSIRVPDGNKVTLAQNYRLTGGKLVLYPGDYPDLPFQYSLMMDANNHNTTSSIKVEKVEGFTKDKQVILYGVRNWNFPSSYSFRIPVGDWTAADGLFNNDGIWKIYVPSGMKITLWDNGDKTGSYHIFDREGQYNLKDVGLLYRVSAVKVEMIDYESVGTSFDDPIKISEEIVATSSKKVRNDSDVEQETSVSISKEMSTSTSIQWENGGSISVTAGITVKVGGEAAAVSAEFKVESTTAYTFNETKSEEKTETRSYSAEQTVKVPPKSATTANLIVKQGKYRIPFKQHFKNKITGEIITRGGTLHTNNGFTSIVDYGEVEKI